MNVSFHNVNSLPANPEPGGIYMVGTSEKHIVIIDGDGNQCVIGLQLYKHTMTFELYSENLTLVFLSKDPDSQSSVGADWIFISGKYAVTSMVISCDSEYITYDDGGIYTTISIGDASFVDDVVTLY